MTGILARIAQAAGQAAARKIAAEFGGRRLYIPTRLAADHRLCLLVGFEAALAIRRELGPGHIDVPMGRAGESDATRRAVARMTAARVSAEETARRLGCAVRTVYRHRAALRCAGLLSEET